MCSKSQYLLTLTACINVDSHIASLSRVDPKEREQDYARTLHAYLGDEHRSVGGVLFIENSNADLSRLQQLAREANSRRIPVEFVSLDDAALDTRNYKGYREYRALDQALNQSAVAKQFPYWVKVTGRYYIKNLNRILARLRLPFDMACDLKDHYLLGYHYQSFDTGLTVYHQDFYRQRVQGLYKAVDEEDYSSNWLENILYRLARQTMVEGMRVIPRFPCTPRVSGFAGHHNKNFDSPRLRAKWMVKSLIRQVAPWLWI